jgi:hypothetical protein
MDGKEEGEVSDTDVEVGDTEGHPDLEEGEVVDGAETNTRVRENGGYPQSSQAPRNNSSNRNHAV